jgi:hypothetical protein
MVVICIKEGGEEGKLHYQKGVFVPWQQGMEQESFTPAEWFAALNAQQEDSVVTQGPYQQGCETEVNRLFSELPADLVVHRGEGPVRCIANKFMYGSFLRNLSEAALDAYSTRSGTDVHRDSWVPGMSRRLRQDPLMMDILRELGWEEGINWKNWTCEMWKCRGGTMVIATFPSCYEWRIVPPYFDADSWEESWEDWEYEDDTPWEMWNFWGAEIESVETPLFT